MPACALDAERVAAGADPDIRSDFYALGIILYEMLVGRVPYLGFFRVEDADRVIQKLDGRGLDAYKRTAGAYSTLGWFKDPILPEMLGWDEFDLADTVLHELAHATLWVPGTPGRSRTRNCGRSVSQRSG